MRLTAAFALLALAACVSEPLESPPPACQAQPIQIIPQQVKDKVDLLFMVDNSGSMRPMTQALQQRFGQLFQAFADLAAAGSPADLHVGVVTSDYGAGLGNPQNGCDAYGGGQGGRLQALGRYAAPGCQAPVGANYLAYSYKDGTSNLPAGQDLVQTFTCMASVIGPDPGEFGCGFESPLESPYAALHDDLPQNAGFLRKDALLAVVFLTNEDDSSAPPTSDLFQTDTSTYGFLDSYRSTRYGILCDGAMPPYDASNGPLANCVPAPDGLELGVQRYIDFFTRPAAQGGVKLDPRDVILVAIDAPEDPVSVILTSDPGNTDYPACPDPVVSASPVCVPVLAHSCVNPEQTEFFGDPAVRINTVVRAASHHAVASICAADYSSAMQQVTDLIRTSLLPGCIPAPLLSLDDPDCAVEDVTTMDDGSIAVGEIPSCAKQPDAAPCWRVEAQAACSGLSPDGVALVIDRKGIAPPPDTDARFACAAACR